MCPRGRDFGTLYILFMCAMHRLKGPTKPLNKPSISAGTYNSSKTNRTDAVNGGLWSKGTSFETRMFMMPWPSVGRSVTYVVASSTRELPRRVATRQIQVCS
jgi:hypothetical protein